MTSRPSTTSMSPTPTAPAGWGSATAPVDVVVDEMRELSAPGTLPSGNSRLFPLPMITGKMTNRYSSAEAGVVQGVDEPAAAVHLELAAGLRLQLLHRGGDVTGDDGGVVPGRVPQRAGHDVLGAGVQLCGHHVVRVGDLGPERLHHVVGGSAQQDLVGLGEPAADDSAEVLVDEGDDPPPRSKPPVRSSSGPPGACMTPSMLRNVLTVSFTFVSLFVSGGQPPRLPSSRPRTGRTR